MDSTINSRSFLKTRLGKSGYIVLPFSPSIGYHVSNQNLQVLNSTIMVLGDRIDTSKSESDNRYLM